MTYALVRHGRTDWNRRHLLQGSSDIPLDDTGREQAVAVARGLAHGGWAVVVTSPLSRARESGRIISTELGIPLGPAYEELRERDYHELEGTSADLALERWPDRGYPGAEPLDSVARRGLAALDRIAADFGDTDVVIVGHGTMIRVMLAALLGRPVDVIENAAISTIRRGGASWRVLTVGDESVADRPG